MSGTGMDSRPQTLKQWWSIWTPYGSMVSQERREQQEIFVFVFVFKGSGAVTDVFQKAVSIRCWS